jgi:hypothetical protein
MNLSCWDLAGFVPGRYAISGVSGTAVSFTVSGFPGSGSGTLTAWGHTHIKAVSTNTTTTNMAINSQRKGWASNADSQVTISTITSKHQTSIINDCSQITVSDSAAGSQTGAYSARGSRREDLPDSDTELYVFLQAKNGATPVAITWTVAFFSTLDFYAHRIIQPATSFNFQTLSGTTNVAGANAHDSSTLMNPVVIGARGVNALITAVASGDTTTHIVDLRGRGLVYGRQAREVTDKNALTLSASVTETTLIASVASVLHDITDIVVVNTSATATRIDFRDSTGGTIRWAMIVPGGATSMHTFSQPLGQTTAANNWTAQSSASVTDVRIYVVSVRS